MLAQQTQVQSETMPFRFVFLNVLRIGDWLVRECPNCHRTGYVSIYPNREREAMAYITRSGWICKPCADIQREVDQNFQARGGDTAVH